MAERESSSYFKNMISALEELRSNEDFCDVTIMVGDQEMKAHRTILSAASKYFKAMFANSTKESESGVVRFPETPPDIVKICMEFIYTGKADFTSVTPQELIHASDMMQLHDLTDLYFQYLLEGINIENCVQYLSLISTYGKHDYRDTLGEFITQNFSELIKSEAFPFISKLDLTYCFDILAKSGQSGFQGIDFEDELLKWNAIRIWINNGKAREEKDVFELLSLLNLTSIPKTVIEDEIYCEEIVKSNNSCLNLITQRIFMDKKIDVAGSTTLNLHSKSKLKKLYAVNNTKSMLYQFDIVKHQWSQHAFLPKKFGNCSFLSLETFKYIDGIFFGFGNVLWKYSPSNDKWIMLYSKPGYGCFNKITEFSPCILMVTSKFIVASKYTASVNEQPIVFDGPGLEGAFAVTTGEDAVYCIGGTNTYQSLDTWKTEASNYAKKYVVRKKKWYSIGSLNDSRDKCAAFTHKKVIYVIGGVDTDGKLVESVEYYQATTDKWYRVTNLNIDYPVLKVYMEDQLYIISSEMPLKIQCIPSQSLEVLHITKNDDLNMMESTLSLAF